jgi:hypothetical protein
MRGHHRSTTVLAFALLGAPALGGDLGGAGDSASGSEPSLVSPSRGPLGGSRGGLDLGSGAPGSSGLGSSGFGSSGGTSGFEVGSGFGAGARNNGMLGGGALGGSVWGSGFS